MITVCNNPKCENYGEPCDLLPTGEYSFYDDAYGAGAWFKAFDHDITDCCRSESFEEYTDRQWQIHIEFGD